METRSQPSQHVTHHPRRERTNEGNFLRQRDELRNTVCYGPLYEYESWFVLRQLQAQVGVTDLAFHAIGVSPNEAPIANSGKMR